MEHFHVFQADIETAPLWVRRRLGFMGVVLMLAISFAFFRVDARRALLVIALTAPAINWILVPFATMIASLAFDYTDAVRCLSGERA